MTDRQTDAWGENNMSPNPKWGRHNNYKGIDPLALIFVYQKHLININIYAKYEKIPKII